MKKALLVGSIAVVIFVYGKSAFFMTAIGYHLGRHRSHPDEHDAGGPQGAANG